MSFKCLLERRRHLLEKRRRAEDITKISSGYLLDILQEDLLNVFWNPEDGRHFKTCRRHLCGIFSIYSEFKKTCRMHFEDPQKICRIYTQYVFSMHFAQLVHGSIRIRAVDKNDKMYKKYATNRQKVCTRGKIPTHTYKGREMNALFHALCGAWRFVICVMLHACDKA